VAGGALALKAVWFFFLSYFVVKKWFRAYLPLVSPLLSQESKFASMRQNFLLSSAYMVQINMFLFLFLGIFLWQN